MLITCCLLAADGVLQISGKRKLTSGKMEWLHYPLRPISTAYVYDIVFDSRYMGVMT